MRYAVSSTATNADTKNLMSQLVLTVKTGDSGSPTTCTGGTGTQLYSGVLSSATSAPGTKIVGDNTTGSQAGDRTLAGAASETLCFNVSLPLATTSGYASASTTATFTFDAEQTANN